MGNGRKRKVRAYSVETYQHSMINLCHTYIPTRGVSQRQPFFPVAEAGNTKISFDDFLVLIFGLLVDLRWLFQKSGVKEEEAERHRG